MRGGGGRAAAVAAAVVAAVAAVAAMTPGAHRFTDLQDGGGGGLTGSKHRGLHAALQPGEGLR